VLRLPYADFRTLRGRSLEGTGVAPDVELSKGLFGDRVQDAALKWLAETRRPA
jgi:C-terminal processing protease CtpA/Prc